MRIPSREHRSGTEHLCQLNLSPFSRKDIFVKRASLSLAPTPESDLPNPPRDAYWEKHGGWEYIKNDASDNYVFGYGSLMADWLDEKASYIANLEGFERDWKAVMDNGVKVAGYKCYLPQASCITPAYVAFVNITAKHGATPITGVVKRVSLSTLADLDRRERNYLRVDVTDRIGFFAPESGRCPARPYRVWAYTASAASLARFDKIKAQPVVDRAYHEAYKQAAKRIAARLPCNKSLNFRIKGSITTQTLHKQLL